MVRLPGGTLVRRAISAPRARVGRPHQGPERIHAGRAAPDRRPHLLGQWIAQNYKGKKVAYFVQNDDFGSDGAKGLDKYIPKEQVVTRQTYEPGSTDIGP